MKIKLLVAALACGVSGMVGTTALAAPNGNANGYWAGRLCDHVGPTTAGVTYWESRGYKNRGQCIKAESGTFDPDTLDPVVYPI